MLALTPRVTHKTLLERVQFAMFLQLRLPWTPLGDSRAPGALQNWPRSKTQRRPSAEPIFAKSSSRIANGLQ